jgi:hypothetical protein
VKSVREPDAGNLQVRFDERRWETELRPRLRHRHYGESRRQQLLPRPKSHRARRRLYPFWTCQADNLALLLAPFGGHAPRSTGQGCLREALQAEPCHYG